MSEGGKDVKARGGKKGIILIAVLVIIIVVLVVVVIALLAKKKEEEIPGTRNVLVNESNVQTILERDRERGQETPRAYDYIITMKDTTWTFENGKSESPDSWVKNDPENDTDVYFDITRNDTGETIYESPILPRGAEIQSVILNSELEAGAYECTMRYSLLDDDHVTVLSTVDLALDIIIQN